MVSEITAFLSLSPSSAQRQFLLFISFRLQITNEVRNEEPNILHYREYSQKPMSYLYHCIDRVGISSATVKYSNRILLEINGLRSE
jgi:hypothetical protein